jgi:hypothetical protein
MSHWNRYLAQLFMESEFFIKFLIQAREDFKSVQPVPVFKCLSGL